MLDIRIGADALAKHLALYDKVIDRKPTIPVLANVKITAQDGGVALAATNLEVSLEGACEAAVAAPGVMTVPAGRLLEIAKALPGAEIRLWQDENSAVRLKGGSYASRLQAIPADDFPTMPAAEPGGLEIPRALMARAIGQVRYGIAAGGDTRYYLNGALLSLGDEAMTMVATDAHRMAIAAGPVPATPPADHIVPARALDALAMLLGQPEDGPVIFSQTGNHLFFRVDGRTLSSRMIDGKYPAWQRILPKGNDKSATMDRALLRTVAQRVMLVSTSGTRALTLSLSKGALRVSALSAEVGDADESMPAAYDGPDVAVMLQGSYLLDFLGEATGAEVAVALADKLKPTLWTDGTDHRAVIMPMNL